MAKNLYWLKRTKLLQDRKMVYLLAQGPVYVVIWLLLQDVAADIQDDGKIYLTETEGMDCAFLAKLIQQKKHHVVKALDLLERLELIERDERGIIRLVPWDDLQDLEKRRKELAQNRSRVAKHRERKAKEQQEAVPEPDVSQPSAALTAYQSRWGQVNPAIASQLVELAQAWGDEAVSRAIDIAAANGTSHVNYIRAILANSNGQPERKENAHERWNKQIDQCLDEILSQGRETSERRENPAYAGNLTAYGQYAGARTESTLTPALQV